MDKNTIIETISLIGKISVEVSSLNNKHKVAIEFGIDFGKEVVKTLTESPKEKMIKTAKMCDIQKITVDIYCSYLQDYTYFHIFGGDNIGFCKMLGIKVLTENEKQIIENYLESNSFLHIWHEEILVWLRRVSSKHYLHKLNYAINYNKSALLISTVKFWKVLPQVRKNKYKKPKK